MPTFPEPNPPDAPLSRRAFLAKSAVSGLSVAGAAVAGCRVAPGDTSFGGIIDTHTHFYDPTRPKGVPWPPREDTFLYRPVYPAEFERLARPLGVTATVVVEASPWEEDNDWILQLADQYPTLVGLVGNLRLGGPGFDAALARLRVDRRFRGIRIGGDRVAAAAAATDAGLRADLRKVSEAGLTVDVLVGPEQLSSVAVLAGALPHLTWVIDHCANVRVDGGPPPSTWVDGVRRCARHDNVWMKVSGLVEGTGRSGGNAPKEVEHYRPVLETVWEAFGPERVIFGSNWPVSARFASYETVFRMVEAFFREKGSRAASLYFRGNALRAYGL